MTSTPPVSVLMPVYNAERFLEQALASVVNQTFGDIEIILVDDCSTDASSAILARYAGADPRIVLLRNEKNLGIAAALNRGLFHCRGRWIARMDADDICMPQRFERQWRYLQDHPELVLLGTKVQMVDTWGRPSYTQPGFFAAHEIIERALLVKGWPIYHPTVFMAREWVEALGGYRDVGHEDHDLFLRLAEHGRLANLDEPLLVYRSYPASSSFVLDSDRHQADLDLIVAAACARRGIAVPEDAELQRRSFPRLYANYLHSWVHALLRLVAFKPHSRADFVLHTKALFKRFL